MSKPDATIYEPLSELPLTGETASGIIYAESGGMVSLGAASIKVPPGAVEADTEITITRLFVTEQTDELSNATAGGGGYRFLPAGQKFLKEAEVRLPYDAGLEAKPGMLEDIATYYYNRDIEQWEALRRIGIENEERLVASVTTHFTDMINGTLTLPEGPEPLSFNINSIKGLEAADPSTGVLNPEGLEAGYMGSANFRFALALPGGRAGMTPQVSIGYSSDGGNGILGKGWSLEAGGEVIYDTRRGLPEYVNNEAEKGKFMLDGVLLGFKESETGTRHRYEPLKESSFERILHYTGTLAAQDYWEVTDKRGTTRIYGADEAWTGPDNNTKYRWLLKSVMDASKNIIRYEYTIEDGEAYLESIWYTENENDAFTGPYRVLFEYNDDREDVQINARGRFAAWTKKLLEKVSVEYTPDGECVRSYLIEYGTQKYVGYSQLVKFGQEDAEKPGDYLWAYDFEYEGFQGEEEDAPVLYGPVEDWDYAGVIQKQEGESGGGSGTISGGAGIGPSYNKDVRIIGSGQFGSSSGHTDTKLTMVDIDGDGKPDIVRMSGGQLKVRLNNGRGFDAEKSWIFKEGSGPGSVGKEKQQTTTRGWSGFIGAATPIISPGINFGETTQESWSSEELGFADINGDGLVDMVQKGKTYYWRNTGSEFEKVEYEMPAMPADVEPELTNEEVLKYDDTFYQQAPFRAWRIPASGTVEVKHNARQYWGKPLTVDGIKIYMYDGSGGNALSSYLLKNGVSSEVNETEEVENMARGDALYFLSDAGEYIWSETANDDITWNIDIAYKSLNYFEKLDLAPVFVTLQERINRDSYNNLHVELKALYKEEDSGGDSPTSTGFWNLKSTSDADGDWVGKGWFNDDVFVWAVNSGKAIPGVLSREGFEILQDKADTLPLKEALFSYYMYDAGLGLFFVNDTLKTEIGADGWNNVKDKLFGITGALTQAENEKLFEVKFLFPEKRPVETLPKYESNRWYYEEEGASVNFSGEDEGGWYLSFGEAFHLDTYAGKDLVVKGGRAFLGGEEVGSGSFSDEQATIDYGGYRQYYQFEEKKAWKSKLSLEAVDSLRQKMESDSWLSYTRWASNVSPAWYNALLDYASGEGLEDAVLDAYEGYPAFPYTGPPSGYNFKDNLSNAKKEALRDCIGKFIVDTFLSFYEEGDPYVIKSENPPDDLYRTILIDESNKYMLYGWTKASRSIRYYNNGLFQVQDSKLPLLVIKDDRFVPGIVDISKEYSWKSEVDFSTEDLLSQAPFYTTESEYETILDNTVSENGNPIFEYTTATATLKHQIETVEILPGGVKQWYYGVWFKGQEASPRYNSERFSEEKLLKQRNDARKLTEADVDPNNQPEKPTLYYTPVAPAQKIEDGDIWNIDLETETGKQIKEKPFLVGPVTAVQRSDEGVISQLYFAPWITADGIHTNRVGGDAYMSIPGIMTPTVVPGMVALNKSYSNGTDTVTGPGFGFMSLSFGDNNSKTYQEQSLQDINGDGYADILQVLDKKIKVTPGIAHGQGDPVFGDLYEFGNTTGLSISLSKSDVTTKGGTISPIGAYQAIKSAKGREQASVATGGVGGSGDAGMGLTSSDGTNTQIAGFVDLNGDGLPDYVNGSSVALNLGKILDGAGGWTPEHISKGESESSGTSFSISGGISGGEQPGLKRSAATASVSLSGSLNVSNSHTSSYSMLLDINGDGLPDKVIKRKNGKSMEVYFNLGSCFASTSKTFHVDDWEDGMVNIAGATQVDEEPPTAGFDNLPYFGDKVKNKLGEADNTVTINTSGMNALDYSSSTSFGLTGGFGVSFSINIYVPFVVPFWINIPISSGGSINWSSFSNMVTMRTMDIDGDGLPDRVLKIAGTDKLFVMLNKAGRVGLLKTVKHPQGGRTELDYKLEYGTPMMPQSKYVMCKLTRYDGEDERATALGYESCHSFETLFEYSDGFYDRVAKEHYGFAKVTSIDPYDTRQETEYCQEKYYLKGMPQSQVSCNVGWNRSTWYEYREEPYAQQEEVKTVVSEGSESYKNTVKYTYGDYGNVITIKDKADGTPELSAEIEWWNNQSKYFNEHPKRIVVSSGGIPIRDRSGVYDENKGKLTKQTQKDGNGNDVLTEILWDGYGNLKELKNGSSSVKYFWEDGYHQFPTKIQRGGGGKGPYTSEIRWDPVFGVKVEETDENGEVISYEYDPNGRLHNVFSPYDQTSPAVSYEYSNETGEYWYAVTSNKVSPNSSAEIRTVIVADGLGKAFITAKDGTIWDNGVKKEGWNITGPVSLDEKGRKVAQGQSLFIESLSVGLSVGLSVDDVLAYRFPAWSGQEFGLRNPTLTKYDTQDRPILVTLPDDSKQTTTYKISDSKSIVTTTDPLDNVTEQYSDARGNIVQVSKRDKDNALLTQATYKYNAIGEMLEAIDYNGNILSVEYDLMGRRIAMESPDMGRKEYHYDSYGNLSSETDNVLRGRSKEIKYEYDGMHRLIKIGYDKYPDSIDTIYEYGDPDAFDGQANRIAKITDESGWIEYCYGPLGETTMETRRIDRLDLARFQKYEVQTIKYTSNYLGQMEEVEFQDGEVVRYLYNRGGQVEKVTGNKPFFTDGGGYEDFFYVTDIGYDEFGQRVYIRYGNTPEENGNGVETWYKYDEKRRWLEKIVTKNPSGTINYQNMEYEFDRAGNVLGYENKVPYYMTSQKYTYDALYQLTGVSGKSEGYSSSPLGVYSGNYRQDFKFDEIGNMTLKDSFSTQASSKPLGDNLLYRNKYNYIEGTHKASQIGGMYYAYDGNGNLTTERAGPIVVDTNNAQVNMEGGIYSTDYAFALRSGSTQTGSGVKERNFSWNERNLLKSSTDRDYHVQYRYGADGQRALKYSIKGTTHTETLYFNKMFQISPVVLEEIESKHIYLGETRIVTKQKHYGSDNYAEEKAKQYFYHGDHIGSAQLVTDYEGKIYEHLEYTPYGELWIDHGINAETNPTAFRFSAKELDKETGFYYYGARYLDPKTSRWISADPAMGDYIPGAPINDEVRKRNGNLPNGGIYNYTSLHLYNYSNNNPIRYTDPDGELPTVVVGAILGGAVGGIIGGVTAVASGGSWQDVVAASYTNAVTGAAMGAIAGTGVGLVGLVVAGGTLSAAGSIANEVISAGLKNGIEGISALDPNKVVCKAAIDGGIGAVTAGLASKIPTSELTKPLDRAVTKMIMSNSETMSNAVLHSAVDKAHTIVQQSAGVVTDTVVSTLATVGSDFMKKLLE